MTSATNDNKRLGYFRFLRRHIGFFGTCTDLAQTYLGKVTKALDIWRFHTVLVTKVVGVYPDHRIRMRAG